MGWKSWPSEREWIYLDGEIFSPLEIFPRKLSNQRVTKNVKFYLVILFDMGLFLMNVDTRWVNKLFSCLVEKGFLIKWKFLRYRIIGVGIVEWIMRILRNRYHRLEFRRWSLFRVRWQYRFFILRITRIKLRR